MSVMWIYVKSYVRLSILYGKNFNIGYYMQTFQSNIFIPAMLIGSFDFWPWGYKVSTKQNLLASFLAHISSHHSEIWCGGEAIYSKYRETTFE